MRTEHYIYRLYIVVFEFLTTIMIRWSSKSPMVRMFRSFDSDFFKTQIEDKKAKIRDLEYKLRRQTDLAIQRNTNNILSNEDMAKIIAESQAKFQAEWLITFKRHELRLGQKVKNTLEDELRNQQKEQYESAVRPYLPITGHPASRTPSPVLEDSEISRKYYSVAQIRLDTLRQLGAYTTPQDILTLVQQTQFLNVHNEISHRIQRWNAASTSRTLWIEGPFQAPEPSRYTLLSAHVVSTAQNANLPVLYYFCNSTTTLVDLLYSLLAQLVQALPSDFQSTKDFSSARFEALSQTADSLDRVIILLRDLLDVGPYALYVIVDGLQVLRRSSSSLVQVQGVVNILRSASEDKRSERSRLTKTLFTTDGFTNALNCLEATERLDGVDFWGEECAGPDFDGIEVDFM